jgi:Vanillate O-demethylase oxygenase C-terminal domain
VAAVIIMPAGQKCKSHPRKSAVERFMETFPAVIAEDRWALEKQQGMFDYPDDGCREVFLRPDRALRRAREILMGLEQAERTSEANRIAAE